MLGYICLLPLCNKSKSHLNRDVDARKPLSQVATRTKASIGKREGKLDNQTRIEVIKSEEKKIREDKQEKQMELEEKKRKEESLKKKSEDVSGASLLGV